MFTFLLAVSQMSAGWQAFFFTAAFVVFVVATIIAWVEGSVKTALIPLGLALYTIVFAWNALAQT